MNDELEDYESYRSAKAAGVRAMRVEFDIARAEHYRDLTQEMRARHMDKYGIDPEAAR